MEQAPKPEKPFRGILQMWGLARLKGTDPKGLIGMVVLHGNGGQTTEITNYKKVDGKVYVETANSKYELGTPNMGFATSNRHLMEELGF